MARLLLFGFCVLGVMLENLAWAYGSASFICNAAGDFEDPVDCRIIHKCAQAGVPSYMVACPPGTIYDTVCKWPYQTSRRCDAATPQPTPPVAQVLPPVVSAAPALPSISPPSLQLNLSLSLGLDGLLGGLGWPSPCGGWLRPPCAQQQPPSVPSSSTNCQQPQPLPPPCANCQQGQPGLQGKPAQQGPTVQPCQHCQQGSSGQQRPKEDQELSGPSKPQTHPDLQLQPNPQGSKGDQVSSGSTKPQTTPQPTPPQDEPVVVPIFENMPNHQGQHSITRPSETQPPTSRPKPTKKHGGGRGSSSGSSEEKRPKPTKKPKKTKS